MVLSINDNHHQSAVIPLWTSSEPLGTSKALQGSSSWTETARSAGPSTTSYRVMPCWILWSDPKNGCPVIFEVLKLWLSEGFLSKAVAYVPGVEETWWLRNGWYIKFFGLMMVFSGFPHDFAGNIEHITGLGLAGCLFVRPCGFSGASDSGSSA